jgi:putative membrane protein
MRHLALNSAAIGAAVLLSGCAASVRTQPAPRPAVMVAPVMLSPAAYVAAASSIDLYEMQSARLALQRAEDPANRAFAERALSVHQGTSAQLSMAGRRLNLLPSATLDAEHQAMMTELAATGDFDNTYRAQQQYVLEQGVRLHGGYARSTDSPTLRPIAQNAENVMRANLHALSQSR